LTTQTSTNTLAITSKEANYDTNYLNTVTTGITAETITPIGGLQITSMNHTTPSTPIGGNKIRLGNLQIGATN